MLNTYNNMGSITTSNTQIKYILEMIHQINLRIPSLLFDIPVFADIIIDEDCLLGNPWGHKYIHKSGLCLRYGKYCVYYSTKWRYYVIESRVNIPYHILKKVKKGKDVVTRDVLINIGRAYVKDLAAAFESIGKHQREFSGSCVIGDSHCKTSNIEYEIACIATSILYLSPDYSTHWMAGYHHGSSLRAPLTMILTMMYSILESTCHVHNVKGLNIKLIEPIWHYPKNDCDVTDILSHITLIQSCQPYTVPLSQVVFCWDAIERNLNQLKIFVNGDILPDEQFGDTHYCELNEDRIGRLFNLIIHLYLHEMGHIKFGLDDEINADMFAKTLRGFVKSQTKFKCDYYEYIVRRIFENYSHFIDETTLDN